MKSSNHLPVSHIRLFSRMALPEDFSMLSVICYFDVISENIFIFVGVIFPLVSTTL